MSFAKGAIVLLVLTVAPGRLSMAEEPKPGDEYPGGPVYVSTTRPADVEYRIEMQFFKAAQWGQCWSAVGRDRAGRIYFGNSTHGRNSFVYRLDPATGRFRYLGDLLSSVRYGIPSGPDNGKIHSTFLEHTDGSVYFLSHYGWGGPVRHGGHLWRLDPRTDRIIDLGVPMPGNTNFCLSDIDPVRNVMYTVSTPAGYLIRYNLKTGTFTALLATGMGGVRFLPMDGAGNVYIVGDNEIHRYSPATERLERIVQHTEEATTEKGFTAMSAFCWADKSRKRLYLLRYSMGSLFAWDVGSPTVEFLGRLHPDGQDLYCNNLHVDPAGNRLYSIGATDKKTNKGLYAFDLARRKGQLLCGVEQILEKELGGKAQKVVYVDFHEHGGVTGDDGTMYTSFFCDAEDPDIDPGKSISALLAIRVTAKE